MSKVLLPLRRVSHLSRCTTAFTSIRTLYPGRYQEGDRFMVDGSKLSNPLIQNSRIELSRGHILHNDIIGKESSKPFFARSSKGRLFRIEQPTLAQYITLTPRVVTPIYSSYAETIVSLLDLHPTPFLQGDHAHENTAPPSLEILDAGTGHGSLTLHLAKAIATANAPPPNLPIPGSTLSVNSKPEIPPPAENEESETVEPWTQWKQSRRAVVHSVEARVKTRQYAEKIVGGFRQGLYWPHVDFHHAEVGQWIGTQMVERERKPFLSYVFLDLPDVQERLRECFDAMHDGAKVLVFVPSITQISDCIKMIRHNRAMRLNVETVVELGEGISNGRTWDVRAVTLRNADGSPSGSASIDKKSAPSEAAESGSDVVQSEDSSEVEIVLEGDDGPTATPASLLDPEVESDAPDPESPTSPNANASDDAAAETSIQPPSSSDPPRTLNPLETVMICRPQIGEKIVGGGFVAIFRKMSPEEWELQYHWRKTRTGVQKKMQRH